MIGWMNKWIMDECVLDELMTKASAFSQGKLIPNLVPSGGAGVPSLKCQSCFDLFTVVEFTAFWRSNNYQCLFSFIVIVLFICVFMGYYPSAPLERKTTGSGILFTTVFSSGPKRCWDEIHVCWMRKWPCFASGQPAEGLEHWAH